MFKQGGRMKILAMRHGAFSPANGGKPTPKTLRRFFREILRMLQISLWACSDTSRTKQLAIRGSNRTNATLIIIKEFNSLETTRWPKFFGGWLYELLHRWQLLNHLGLILWWVGFPIFTEGPAQFLERTRIGLEKLLTASTEDEVFLICHQETIIALRMIVNKEGPIKAFNPRRRIKHLEVITFDIP